MNILTKYLSKINKHVIYGFFITLSFQALGQAQEEQSLENNQAFISDDLFIFMHAGPGTNYRILGTINAGSEIKTTGNTDKGYSEILDENNRLTWVETKNITSKPGLRFVLADLNGKLANASEMNNKLDGRINELENTLEQIKQEKEKLQNNFTQVSQQLKETESLVKDQDTEIKKQWFFNGAMVLGIGLLLGLVLPKFFGRRRSSMDSWG